MSQSTSLSFQPSPFHRGEQAIQKRLGVREKMERFGQQVIRNFMPDQHQAFYAQLPFVLAGHADGCGWPWASLLFNSPGFMHASDPHTLHINAQPVLGDPLKLSLKPGTALGLLGIELASRRRNRMSAYINRVDNSGIELKVKQTFGNCPQYIQTRTLNYLDDNHMKGARITPIRSMNANFRELIASSDTFFVASYSTSISGATHEGVDVSHRGGKPGFIRVDNDLQLTVPDYLGNFHFNTLGNFLLNPKAGLLFIDFNNGHLLSLTGTVEIIWDSPEIKFFKGAERLWSFRLDHGVWLEHVVPFQWQFKAYSANTQLTGNWEQAKAAERAESLRDAWLPYQVVNIVEQSPQVKSVYLKAPENQRPNFEAGQFLTVKAEIDEQQQRRTYTVSSAPGDALFRISVKHERGNQNRPQGVFSSYIHQRIKVGDTLEAKAPKGLFTLNPNKTQPALLISAGIGITPMVSMARHVLQEGIRTRHMRQLILICAARNHQERVFYQELNEIAEQSGGQIQILWALSQPERNLNLGSDFHFSGRINRDWLQSMLPSQKFEAFICGPSDFMQNIYQILRALDVPDAHIFAEAFGPASLVRDSAAAPPTKLKPLAQAQQAIIVFSLSKVEQAWSKADGNLLAFSEKHGLTPEYGCRNGQCGSCKVRCRQGKVAYLQDYSVPLADDELLLCCAVPGLDPENDVPTLEIEL